MKTIDDEDEWIAQHRVARRCFLDRPRGKRLWTQGGRGGGPKKATRWRARSLCGKIDAPARVLLPRSHQYPYAPTIRQRAAVTKQQVHCYCYCAILAPPVLSSKEVHLWSWSHHREAWYIMDRSGIGKSFLMDLFYASVTVPDDDSCCHNDKPQPQTTQDYQTPPYHFNEFMLDAITNLLSYKQEHPEVMRFPSLRKHAQEAQTPSVSMNFKWQNADAWFWSDCFCYLLDCNVRGGGHLESPPDACMGRH